MSHAPWVAFLWGFAFLFAAVEVEIEGAYGWAERLPTWFRTQGRVPRAFGLFMNRRPLTGYHSFMLPLPLFAFHLPFFQGLDWTLGEEARILGAYLAWSIVWDYLWFVLNPAYGARRFRLGAVWWYPGPWVFRFPFDYWLAIGVSTLLAAATWLERDSPSGLYEHLGLLAGFAVLTGLAVIAAPAYHRWYLRMRRPGSDERHRVQISPPPGPVVEQPGSDSPPARVRSPQ